MGAARAGFRSPAAVNSIFISASNELGGFESELVASPFGPIVFVVSGGIGTILVVLIVARIWPEMRNLKSLDRRVVKSAT